MAFCNSCGATLTPGTRFCNKCGAAVVAAPSAGAPAQPAPAVSVSAPAPPPTAAQKGGGSALKIILIVVVVIVTIGVLGLATLGIIAYRVAKSAHVRQQGGQVSLETPFGNVESPNDPEQAAKNLGVDIYPGAQVQKEGTSSAMLGSIHTVTANFASSDSVDKICDFYKTKFPGAMTTTADANHCTIVSSDNQNMITINIKAAGDTTKFLITSVSKKAASSD